MALPDSDAVGARARRRRRRFGLLAAAVLAVAAAALGVSYTADTGVNTPTVTAAATSKLVFTQQSQLPTGFSFRVSTVTGAPDGTVPTPPTMTPVTGTAGTVTAKGDIAVIDARSSSTGGQGQETITIYLANLKALTAAYSQFAFPVRLYQGLFDHQPTYDSTEWDAGNGYLLAASQHTYLTNTSPNVSFTVPTLANATMGNVLAVQLGEDGTSSPGTTTGDGGSFYSVCTDTATTCTGAALGPQFYIAVQPGP